MCSFILGRVGVFAWLSGLLRAPCCSKARVNIARVAGGRVCGGAAAVWALIVPVMKLPRVPCCLPPCLHPCSVTFSVLVFLRLYFAVYRFVYHFYVYLYSYLPINFCQSFYLYIFFLCTCFRVSFCLSCSIHILLSYLFLFRLGLYCFRDEAAPCVLLPSCLLCCLFCLGVLFFVSCLLFTASFMVLCHASCLYIVFFLLCTNPCFPLPSSILRYLLSVFVLFN